MLDLCWALCVQIAAYLGGACAQEVIKLVTHQYIPVNGTYLYNSITGKAVTLSI